MNILFVCTGNTCRSPMAEGLLRLMAEEENQELTIQSAGIAAFPGAPASKYTDTLLRARDMVLDHQAQPVTAELLNWADLILTMTSHHKDAIGQVHPFALDKLFTLKEYIGVAGTLDVVDPFGGSLENYRSTERDLMKALKLVLKKTKNG